MNTQTIWDLIKQRAHNLMEEFHLTLFKVERIEATEIYLATFKGFVANTPEYGKYQLVWLYCFNASGKLEQLDKETIDPAELAFPEEEDEEA